MSRLKVAFALVALAVAFASPRVMAQDTSSPSGGSHQVDRFEAIRILQESLKSNPKDAAGWIVLGELAHEVAQDLSSSDDRHYYELSVAAFEKAVALQPENTAIKAELEFARDQLAGADQWDKVRMKAARTYVEKREHELVAAKFSTAVLIYPPPRAAVASAALHATPAPHEAEPPASTAASPASRVPASPATTPAAAAPPATTTPTYLYVYVPYYVQVPQYTYVTPTYGTYVSATSPGMHGAHRRRSER
jgi:hypothetical protein